MSYSQLRQESHTPCFSLNTSSVPVTIYGMKNYSCPFQNLKLSLHQVKMSSDCPIEAFCMKEACEANLENLFSKLNLVLPGGNYYTCP